MARSRLLVIFWVVVWPAGCGPQRQPENEPGELRRRLESAQRIANPTLRDAGLGGVAKDAAGAGDVDVVKGALGAMTNPEVRDRVAADCAGKLADRGDTRAATEVAKLIADEGQRSKVLARVAGRGD